MAGDMVGDADFGEVETYRQVYQRDHAPRIYDGRLHLLFTVSLSAFLIWLGIHKLHFVTHTEYLAVPLTLFYNNLVEYLGHRGPMHRKRRFLSAVYRRHTRQHHRYFTHASMEMTGSQDYYAVLFPPILVVFFTAVFGVPAWFLLVYLFGPNVAWLFVATSAAYFLNYELFHLSWHLPRTSLVWKIPGMAYLARLHTFHHDPALMAKRNFNISWPLCDWLFGTLHQDERKVD